MFSQRIKKNCHRGLRLLLGLAVIALLLRNEIAKLAIEQVGSLMLGCPLSVEKVAIQLHTIDLLHVTIHEPLQKQEPLLEIASIQLAPTLLSGVKTGSWLRFATINDPCLRLRFDASGKLLSKLPKLSVNAAASEAPLELPRIAVQVANASLLVQQTGKRTLTIYGADLQAKIDDHVYLELRVKHILNSSLTLRSRLDSQTYTGQTFASLEPLLLDGGELSQYALVPAILGTIGLCATLEAKLRIDHPGKDKSLLLHDIEFQAQIADASTTLAIPDPQAQDSDSSRLHLSDHITLHATNTNGNFSSLAESRFQNGSVRFQVQSNLTAETPVCEAALDVREVQLGRLASRLLPDLPIQSTLDSQGRVTATYTNKSISFDGQLDQRLADVRIDQQPIEPVHATLTCVGLVPDCEFAKADGDLRLVTRSGIDLTALGKRIGVSIDSGTCRFDASLSIPLSHVLDPNFYAAEAILAASPLKIDGLNISPAHFVTRLDKGAIDIQVAPVSIRCLHSAARPPFNLVDRARLSDSTRAEFSLNASTHWAQALDPASWKATAKLRTHGVEVAGEEISDIDVQASLGGGELSVSEQELRWRDNRLTLGARGSLSRGTTLAESAAKLDLHFESSRVELASFAEILNRFSSQTLHLQGSACASGTATIELPGCEFFANGNLEMQESALNSVSFGNARMTWEANLREAHLRSQSDQFLGGGYSIDATLTSLDWTQAKIDASFRGIELRRLCELGNLSVPVSGSLEGNLHIDSLGNFSHSKATLQIASRNASFQGIPFQFATRRSGIHAGQLLLEADAVALDGNFGVNVSGSLQRLADWVHSSERDILRLPLQGSLVGTNISLQKCVGILDRSGAARSLSGKIAFQAVRSDLAEQQGWLATAEATLSNASWKSATLASRIRVNTTLFPTRIEVHNLEGRIAEGRLDGQATLSLDRSPRGSFRLGIENINVRRAVAPIPGLSKDVSGTASVAMSGQIGSVLRADVKARAANLRGSGIAIREMRLPLTVTYGLATNRLGLQSRGGMIRAGGGTISPEVQANWTHGLTTANASIDIRNLDSAKLLSGMAVNVGTIEGKLNLQGVRARSIDDLYGSYHLEFTELQNLDLPGYDQFSQLINLPAFTVQRAEEIGIVDGRIRQGVVYLDQASLTKHGLLALADGTVSQQGRINVNIVAITDAGGPADGLLDLMNSPLMLAAPAPIALIAKANDALKDRTFYVRVGGTPQRPVLNIQHGKGLTQDALRFVLKTTLGSRATDVALKRNHQLQSIQR